MRILPRERSHRLFEKLEARTLMSAVISPGSQNDAQAIQAALNSAQGGTVQLTAGTYQVSSTLNLDGATLAGVPGKTVLQWGGGNGYVASSGSNSSLTGVTFDGGGLQITDNAQNVTVKNDTFENIGDGFDAYHSNGITAMGGANKLEVAGNTFSNISGDGAYLFSLNESHFDSNTLTNCYEGIHAINFGGTSAGNNCTFDYNTLTGVSRHGIEIQNNWDNLSVGWNTLSDFNVQPGGNSHIALSIATGPGTGGATAENVDVHDNVILGTGPGVPSNPNTNFTAIEIMGDASVVNHNYIANWGWGILDGWSSNWKVTNNAFVGVTSQNGDAVPEYNGTSPSVDSGNTSTGSWDGKVPSNFAISAGSGSSGSSSSSTSSNSSTSTSSSSSSSASTGNNGWSTPSQASPAKTTATTGATSSTTPKPSKGSGSGNGKSSASIASVLRQTLLGER